jgi:putative transposase
MPRQARLDCPGTLHHVMVRGIEKGPIVLDDKDREDFLSRLGLIAGDTDTEIYAWCLMPNHAHILLRSGPEGMVKLMRRLLTGYAVMHNRRHDRHGHLFQNRYKSIVCDEDAYFLELIRYIHLNPLRSGLVEGLAELEKYPWCGHGVLLGKSACAWMNRRYVLSWFGKNEIQAVTAYVQFVNDGADQGNRPELVGGGLVRCLGGWSEVRSLRRNQENVMSDARILGGEGFIRQILGEADKRVKYQIPMIEKREQIARHIHDLCQMEGVGFEELKGGSRRGRLCMIRRRVVHELVNVYGVTPAETARQVGVSSSAVSRILKSGDDKDKQGG